MKLNYRQKIILSNMAVFLIIFTIILIPRLVFAEENVHKNLAESINQGYITTAWKYVLGLLNGIVVLGLILVALSNILRINIEVYHIKRMLPSIIIGVILANFSFLISRLMVDFAQVAAKFFIGSVNGVDIVNIFGFKGLFSSATTPVAGAGAVAGIIGAISAAATVGGLAGFGIGVVIFIIIVALVIIGLPLLCILVLGFLLAVRTYLIWFLVIVSPIAFFGLMFTPARKAWELWWSWFIKWLFLAPISFLFIRLASIAAGAWGDDNPGFGKWFFGLVLLGLAIYMPFMLGGKIVSGWADLWKRAAGYGVKGGRYTGVFGGGAMASWGERRKEAGKTGRLSNFLSGVGGKIQQKSYYEDMKKELLRFPGGLAASEALAAQEGGWARKRAAGGFTGGVMRGLVGEKERHKIGELAFSGIMTNSNFTSDAVKETLKDSFGYIALSEDEIYKRRDEINHRANDDQMSTKVIAGKRRMEHLTKNQPNAKNLRDYQEAYNMYNGDPAKDDPGLKLVGEQDKIFNKEHLYNWQRLTAVPQGSTGAPFEPGPPVPKEEFDNKRFMDHFSGGVPTTPEFKEAGARRAADYLKEASDREIDYLSQLPNPESEGLSDEQRGQASLKSAQLMPHLEQAMIALQREGNTEAADKAQRLINSDPLLRGNQIANEGAIRVGSYITKYKEKIEADPATVAEATQAIRALENAGGIDADDQGVIRESYDVLRRISPKSELDLQLFQTDPRRILSELKDFQSIGNILRQNPAANKETITQQYRLGVARDYHIDQISQGLGDLLKDRTTPEQIQAALSPESINAVIKPKIKTYYQATLGESARLKESDLDGVISKITDKVRSINPPDINIERIQSVIEEPLVQYSQKPPKISGQPVTLNPPAAPVAAIPPANPVSQTISTVSSEPRPGRLTRAKTKTKAVASTVRSRFIQPRSIAAAKPEGAKETQKTQNNPMSRRDFILGRRRPQETPAPTATTPPNESNEETTPPKINPKEQKKPTSTGTSAGGGEATPAKPTKAPEGKETADSSPGVKKTAQRIEDLREVEKEARLSGEVQRAETVGSLIRDLLEHGE